MTTTVTTTDRTQQGGRRQTADGSELAPSRTVLILQRLAGTAGIGCPAVYKYEYLSVAGDACPWVIWGRGGPSADLPVRVAG